MTEQQKIINSNLNTPMWVDILLKNKVNPTVIPFIIAQIILESGWYSSNTYLIDHNPGGITWNDNYKMRPGASIGISRPANEGGHYVHFNNFDSAAKDYIRILSKQATVNHLGKPIDAKNPLDYATRLKYNNYYKSALVNYANAISSISNRIQQYNDIASLIKKNSSLNMAGLNPVIILFILSFIFLKK